MKLRLYSKEVIGILSLLISPFLGCILLTYNLREIGKSKLNPFFIIGGLVWLPMIKLLTNGLDLLIQLAIVNVLGSLLLTFYFWDKYFDNYTYEKRSFWNQH